MIRATAMLFLCAAGLLAGDQDPEANVNTRYTVESADVTTKHEISRSLRGEIQKLVGGKFDAQALEDLAGRIRRELHVPEVNFKISRGSDPQHVKVVFKVVERKRDFDASVSSFGYQSKQGWTGAGQIATDIKDNRLHFGVVSDGDRLIERFAGIRAGYEGRWLGTDRVRLRFEFESFHEQWNRETDLAGRYRARENYEPSVTIVLARPLTLTTGISIQHLQTQFPAARNESSNAVVNTLRYRRDWKDSDTNRHSLDAGYTLRAATRVLGTDFVYARQSVELKYRYARSHQAVLVNFLGGAINGQAPLWERFVLGNSALLRGWNKYDLDPNGGNRVAYGSVEYHWQIFEVFYDTGSIWERRQAPVARNSVGVGFQKEGFSLAVAFPLREGHVVPVLVAGLKF